MAGLGIFVLLLGVATAVYGWLGHSKALALKQAAGRWAIAPATILATDVRVVRRGGAAYWVPLVHYRFAVGARQYEGQRLRFGFIGTQTRAAAERMIAGYAPGSTAMLRYDPHDPQESVLDPNHVTSNMLVCAVGGAVLALIGLAIVIAS
ncbi:MAG TPA: DUF3592 domain-containing protein [Allosphingosinicella sp.]|jgi:hypothetical protein